jgi:hypothetical protein
LGLQGRVCQLLVGLVEEPGGEVLGVEDADFFLVYEDEEDGLGEEVAGVD